MKRVEHEIAECVDDLVVRMIDHGENLDSPIGRQAHAFANAAERRDEMLGDRPVLPGEQDRDGFWERP